MERAGFFNSNGNDRVYDAGDFAQYFGNLVSNGIFYATPTNLAVTAATGMNVSVAAGSAWINGYCYTNTSDLELTLNIAHGTSPRVDCIVVRWNLPNREIKLAVVTGVPSANPVPTPLTRTSDTYELCLADVLVPASSASVSQNNIFDMRLDGTVCGLVNSLVSAVYQ